MSLPLTDKFTGHLKRSLRLAHAVAAELGHAQVTPEHLLYGLAANRGSLAAEVLGKLSFGTEQLKELLVRDHANPMTVPSSPLLSEPARIVLQRAVALAGTHAHRYVGTEHVLHALIEHPTATLQQLLARQKITQQHIAQQLELVLRSTSRFSDLAAVVESGTNAETEAELERLTGAANSQTNVLELFTTDLTNRTVQQSIDPVIGREVEIARLTQILCRRTKNNPVLLGDPGVGKTAIVEGLAKKILNGDVPEVLLDKRILMLDLGLLLAGTMYRGEFEQRLKNVIGEIQADSNIILFIDELHTLTGAGAAPGSLDAANILKPALARGQIRCIGATTLEEYRKHIESDPALERRFQPIAVAEPNPEKTVQILRGIKGHYEQFHHVAITDNALTAAVQLSVRYLPDRFLPDKAIDLIDEAAARLRVTQNTGGLVQKIKKISEGIELLRKNKHTAITSQRYSEALEYQNHETVAQAELSITQAEFSKVQQQLIGTVTERDIAAIVSHTTGIPFADISQPEQKRLANLTKAIQRRIVGQDAAISQVTAAIRRARAGISNQRRPIGSFIFLGPSGVGKTELARALAAELFEDERALLKIDMSEFHESFNVSKLIGSPPGYVGYKESGQLTEAVRRKPYSVVLFDEIEKAHPEVFNLLLQVMEDGELTDGAGKRINFRNTLIIMTSNVGLKEFVNNKRLGFGDVAEQEELVEEMKGYLEKSLTDQFRPEFLNRLDGIIFFRPLIKGDLKKITKFQLAELNTRLKDKKITLKTNAAVIDLLVSRNANPTQGARLIRKNIQELLEQPLSEGILSGKYQKGAIIQVRRNGDQLTLE